MEPDCVKKSLLLLPAVLLSLSLAGCGETKDEEGFPKLEAGENVAAPEGQQWSDVVATTPNGGYVMGNPDAAIKVAEYGSYTCPHCADFVESSSQDIDSMVDTGKMSFEFRPYVRDPLDMTVALLAGCTGPEAYFPLSHQLFANQAAMYQTAQGAGDAAYASAMEKPPEQRFIALAEMSGLIDFVKQRGVSEDKAKQCLSDTQKIEALAGHVQEANTRYNITGTPTLLINNSVVENANTWDVLKAKLKEAGI